MSTSPGSIVRRHLIVGTDNPAYQVSKNEWNEPLVIDSAAPDGALLIRDRSQPDGYAFTDAIPETMGVPPWRTVNGHPLSADVVVTKEDIGLGNVENIKLSTWGGSTALSILGIVTVGVWRATIIEPQFGGTGSPYVQFTGPTALHTYTLPNDDATLLTHNDVIPPSMGGTGVTTGLTELNASNLTSGIVPDERLSGNIARTNVPNNIPWYAVNKAGSSIADLQIRSASDLNLGVLPLAQLPPHHTWHEAGGIDGIKLDDLVLPDDNTDLNASVSRHGLLPKLSGNPAHVLSGTGQWVIMTGGSGGGGGGEGGGDVVGLGNSVLDHVPVYADDTGKTIYDSGLAITMLARVNQPNTWSQTQTFQSDVVVGGNVTIGGTLTVTGGIPASSLVGTVPIAQGGTGVTTGLTQLDASNLTSGTVPDARLSTNVQMKPILATDIPPHKASHQAGGGADSIPLDTLSAPSDITALNATTLVHGLLPKLSGVSTQYLDGTGAWTAPAGGGGGLDEVYVGPSDPGGSFELWYDTDEPIIDGGGGVMSAHAPTHAAGGSDQILVTSLAGYPGTAALFLRGDGVFSSLPTGPGDVVGPAVAVNNNLVLWDGTTGKLLKDGGKALPAGALIGTTDTQTLTNKTLTAPVIGDFTAAGHSHQNTAGGGLLTEAALNLTDLTTNNASATKHGFLPKLPNTTTTVLRGDGTWVARSGAIGFVIDGGGAVITTGLKGFLEVPFACVITGVTILSTDPSQTVGNIVIDIWKDTYTNYAPTVADSITASAKPTLASANKSKDTTLTGWNKTLAAGDILAFNVDSVATVTRIAISLAIQATG